METEEKANVDKFLGEPKAAKDRKEGDKDLDDASYKDKINRLKAEAEEKIDKMKLEHE